MAEWDVLVGPSHVASQGLGILIFEMGVLIELWVSMDGQGSFSMAGSTGFGPSPHTCGLLSAY